MLLIILIHLFDIIYSMFNVNQSFINEWQIDHLRHAASPDLHNSVRLSERLETQNIYIIYYIDQLYIDL